MHWFTLGWWQYLLGKSPKGSHGTGYISKWRIIDWACRVVCRAEGHPCGPYYYNFGDVEPDMRCRDCGDYIG